MDPTLQPRRSPARLPSRLLAAFLLLLAAGCGADQDGEFSEVRDRPARPPSPDLSPPERLRLLPPAGGPGGHAPHRVEWKYEVPQGWEALPTAPAREFGFRSTANSGVECTFSLARGDLLANLNRWRDQMTLPPVDAAAAEALERRPFLGRAAAVVELEGTWKGMRDGVPLEGARLLGLVASLPATGAFLKMVGPAAGVEAERERFFDLADSIRSETPPAPPPTAAPAGPDAPFRWTTPDGWTEEPGRGMRLATFRPKAAAKTEVTLSILGGDGGGLGLNLNRWREQMGLDEASDAEIAALPRATILGAEAVFISLDGHYRGMGESDLPEARFLGMILLRDDHAVFVKMYGPAEEVRPEEARWRAFCESLRE